MSASVSPAPFDEVSAAPMFSPASSSSSSRGTKKPRHSFIAKRRTSTVMNDQVGALEAFMAESTSIESDQEQKKQEPREEADRVSAPSFGCRAKLKYHMLSQMESERQQVLIIMMSTSIVVLLGFVFFNSAETNIWRLHASRKCSSHSPRNQPTLQTAVYCSSRCTPSSRSTKRTMSYGSIPTLPFRNLVRLLSMVPEAAPGKS